MKNSLNKLEAGFEKLSEIALKIYGHSVTFIIAIILVTIWLLNVNLKDNHDVGRDFLLGFTFISFFLVQKSVNKYSKAIQVKLNELVAAHENANNKFVKIEEKTEAELEEMGKSHSNTNS